MYNEGDRTFAEVLSSLLEELLEGTLGSTFQLASGAPLALVALGLAWPLS